MNYRNTRIYRRSLELIVLTHQVIGELPRGCGFLADQLRRAASSITLNFAEGCGKGSAADRRRYLQIARASAYEVAAAFDVGQALSAIQPASHARAIDLCDHLAAMLTQFGAA